MSEIGIMLVKVGWRTLSNAFVKLDERTWTNCFDVNSEHTVRKRATTAAVVEPDGLNAKRSSKCRPGRDA